MFIHDTVTDFTDNYLPTIEYLKNIMKSMRAILKNTFDIIAIM